MSTTTRTHCRAGATCDPRTFEEAADCLGHHSSRTLTQIASAISRSYNYLKKALSANQETHPLRGDLVVPLTLASAEDPRARNYALLDWMEAQVGRVAFVVPTAADIGDADLLQRVHNLSKEFTDMLARVTESARDGRTTPDEVEDVAREFRELQAAGAALLEHLRASAVTEAPLLRRAK